MSDCSPARAKALAALAATDPGPNLLQHALASEAVLRALARKLGEDEEIWGLTGLLHDFDYPQTKEQPERHGLLGAELLAQADLGLSEHALQAIRAHNSEMNGVPVQTSLDTALRCGESVTGLVITAALVRPTGLEGLEAKSLKKKMKDKAFAASVNREIIRECANLNLELDDFLNLAVAALQPIAAELGCLK